MTPNNDKSAETIPDRCFDCKHCGYDHHLEYYPYYVCKLKGWEICFCEKEGWHRMVWCPLVEKKDGVE